METRKLYRSQTDKMFTGVCGGIGEYFRVDSTIVRLAAALLTVFTGGTALLIYLIAALVIPREDGDTGGRGCAVGCLVVLFGIPVLGAIGALISGLLGAAFYIPMKSFHFGYGGDPFGVIVSIFFALAGITLLVGLIIGIIFLIKKSGKKG